MGITVGAIAKFYADGSPRQDEHLIGANPYTYGGSTAVNPTNGRYTITTDEYGAARIIIGGLTKIKTNKNALRLDVTDNDSSHKTGSSEGVALAEDGTGYIDIDLMPSSTYYVWLFCNGSSHLYNDSAISITSSGSYGSAATPVASDGYFDETLMFTLVGATAGATYDVYIDCAGRRESPSTWSNTSSTMFGWYPTSQVYAPLVTTTGYADAVITCKTRYNGTVMHTTTTTVRMRFKGLEPIVSSGWVSISHNNTGTDASGINAFVQGYSYAMATFDPTKITCKYNASITGYSIEYKGVKKSISSGTVVSTDNLINEVYADIVCSVTDSRGSTTSATITIELNQYYDPVISGIDKNVYHSDSGGNADENGSFIAVTAVANIASIKSAGGQELNSPTLTFYTKSPSASSYSSIGTFSSGVKAWFPSNHSSTGTYSPDLTWDAKVVLTDALGHSATYLIRLPTKAWAMKFRPDGNGVGFGKAPEIGSAIEIPNSWKIRFGEKYLHADMIGPTETTAQASAPHLDGSFFLWGGNFVEATSDIGIGDAISGKVSTTSAAQALSSIAATIASQGSKLDSHTGTLDSHTQTLAAHTLALSRISVQTITLDNQSAPRTYNQFTLDATRSGYTPIGVVGYRIDNATDSGINCSWVAPYRVALYNNGDTHNVEVYLRNYHSSNSAKIKISVDVLYI